MCHSVNVALLGIYICIKSVTDRQHLLNFYFQKTKKRKLISLTVKNIVTVDYCQTIVNMSLFKQQSIK